MDTVSQHPAVRCLPRQGKGCRRHPAAKIAPCADSPDNTAFLKHRFQPLVGKDNAIMQDWRQKELAFFRSLACFAASYTITPPDVSGRVYPDNIRCAFTDLKTRFAKIRPDDTLLIVADTTHAACVCAARPMDLKLPFQIPVRPLWDLLQDSRKKKLSRLLLSVFSYLYQLAGVPYFRDASCYFGNAYERLQEWHEESAHEQDEEDYTAQEQDLRKARYYGDKLKRSLRHPFHLSAFGGRLANFQPEDQDEQQWRQVCHNIYRLWQQYPERSLMDNIYVGLLQPEEEQRIYPDMYLSFYWDCNDGISYSLDEILNSDAQEAGVTDVPVSLHYFDQPSAAVHGHQALDYERRLFDLIDQLNDLLWKISQNNLPKCTSQ